METMGKRGAEGRMIPMRSRHGRRQGNSEDIALPGRARGRSFSPAHRRCDSLIVFLLGAGLCTRLDRKEMTYRKQDL